MVTPRFFKTTEVSVPPRTLCDLMRNQFFPITSREGLPERYIVQEVDEFAPILNIDKQTRMKTLDLQQASELLRIHPVTLQAKAKAGEIPGAKPGKRWVFIEEDLLEYLRDQYTYSRRDAGREEEQCSSNGRVVPIGTTNLLSGGKRYTDLLEPKTKRKQKK